MKKFLLLFMAFMAVSITISAQDWVTCPSCQGSKKEYAKCSYCHNGAIMCNQCYNGTKRTRCGYCSGGYVSKTVKQTCSTCQGSRTISQNQRKKCSCRDGRRPVAGRDGRTRYVDCSRCGGTGELNNYVRVGCPTCNATGYSGTHTVREKCYQCDNGYVSETCSTCSGRGSYICSTCEGYSNVTRSCSRCNAYGKIAVYR